MVGATEMRRGLQQVTLTLPHSRDLGRKPKEEPWSVRPVTDDRLRADQREEEKRGEAGAREDPAAAANAAAADARAADATGKR